jgi:ABC-2 type transport system ATP-binding protein
MDLRVGPGEIYGFVGLNGAGKTTTIRLLLGMLRPSAGTASVLGEAIGPRGIGPWARVGHFVGSPAAYPQLTVRENLEIARRLHGLPNPQVTDGAIDRFGLVPYAGRKAAALSSGNLQRLCLARAMLHNPELLILDEPANGLDPSGVVEVRELLRSLAESHGVTIFMSSHILTEVDRLATRIGIIHQGRLIEELDAHGLEQLRAPRLQIQVRNMAAARQALERAGFAVQAIEAMLLVGDDQAVRAPDDVASLLVHAGTPPLRLVVAQEDLESHFLRLVGRMG